ncbi:DNA-binding protein [Candidatus Parcubacteria bacterium]|nr:MAG: DNA-binding protein [Candidatus Parcubacteria bacterium]
MRVSRAGISKHMSYAIKELVAELGVNEKTVLRWIGNGLPTVEGCKKPILISGDDLIRFLKNKDAKKRVKLGRSQFFCMTCKAPRLAKRGSAETLYDRKVARCSVCSGKMSRTIKPHQKGLFDTPP